jgi:hypothetical protein
MTTFINNVLDESFCTLIEIAQSACISARKIYEILPEKTTVSATVSATAHKIYAALPEKETVIELIRKPLSSPTSVTEDITKNWEELKNDFIAIDILDGQEYYNPENGVELLMEAGLLHQEVKTVRIGDIEMGCISTSSSDDDLFSSSSDNTWGNTSFIADKSNGQIFDSHHRKLDSDAWKNGKIIYVN